jgi:hypothetical protein
LDFKRIRLGSRWKDEVTTALDQTDVTLVYWTRSAASSVWVRNEYEYFLGRYPSRPLVPIAGDETPLAEPLKERQAMSFVPVINELLDLKRRMEAEGRKKAEIQSAIRQRLEQAGIRLDKSDENRIFRLFGIAGWFTWLPAPLVLFEWVWRSIFEAAVNLSAAQIVLMLTVAAAAVAVTGQAATRNAFQRERQAEAREGELASQLQEARDRSSVLERQVKARREELSKELRNDMGIPPSHALVKVVGMKKPVLLKLVDLSTGQHRFTV